MITLQTNHGLITIVLDVKNTPVTAENFLQLAKSGFYDGVIFHRVMDGFMVQGGGFDSDMRPKTGHPTIQNEANKSLANKRGTLAMARTSDPHSASTQFFINVVDNVPLDTNGGGYAVFGKVVAGLDIVDKIKVVPTSVQGGMSDVPVTPVIINSVVQTQ